MWQKYFYMLAIKRKSNAEIIEYMEARTLKEAHEIIKKLKTLNKKHDDINEITLLKSYLPECLGLNGRIIKLKTIILGTEL